MSKVRGGDKAISYLRNISNQVDKAPTLRVGFLSNATYPDGTKVALVAALNEYGHKTRSGRFVGPWPFMRNTVQKHSKEWPAALAIQLKKTNYDVVAAFKIMGEGIRGQMQEQIRAIQAPALSPVTIARKGFSKPMIDTGHMLNSVDFEVTKKRRK